LMVYSKNSLVILSPWLVILFKKTVHYKRTVHIFWIIFYWIQGDVIWLLLMLAVSLGRLQIWDDMSWHLLKTDVIGINNICVIPLSKLKRPWFHQFATFVNSYLCFV
jgi:hypothetical protein